MTRLRVLFLSSVYSTPEAPGRGPPNGRIVRAMRASADVRVISPVPYYPGFLFEGLFGGVGARRPELAALARMRAREPDFDGEPVLHPRVAHLPVVGRALAAGLYGASLVPLVRREVNAFRPHALLAAWAYPDGTAAVGLGELFGVPTVVRCMGSDVNSLGLGVDRKPQLTWALGRAARVVAVSEALREQLVSAFGVRRERVAVIPTGVDTRVFSPHERDAASRALGLPTPRERAGPVLFVPSRLSPEKGLRFFLDGLAKLPASAVAVLAGDGPEEHALREQVGRLGLGARVRFEGFQRQDRLPLYYSAADVACLASLEEGWPNALMEAQACGCPWVASAVGGVPEIERRWRAGLLTPPGDAEGLARALAEASSRAWDRGAIAESMRAFGIAETGAAYVEAVRDVAHEAH